MGNTLFDKIWDKHVVATVTDGPTQLYIDRHYCHEVTSPQAFQGMRNRNLRFLRPEKTFCIPDHNIPTLHQDQPIEEPISRKQVETLTQNANDFGVTLYGLGHKKNGVELKRQIRSDVLTITSRIALPQIKAILEIIISTTTGAGSLS